MPSNAKRPRVGDVVEARELTDEQRGDMLHALGLDECAPIPKCRSRRRGKYVYRNYYAVDIDSPSGRSWLDLEAKGLAVHRMSLTVSGGCVFFVTWAGVMFLGVEHLIGPSADVCIPGRKSNADN